MKRALRTSAMLSLFFLPIISGCSVIDKQANEPFRPVDDGRYHSPLPKDAEKTNGPVSPEKKSFWSDTKNCKRGEQYSRHKWQWISWEVCVDGGQRDHNPLVSFTILDAQHYWGGAWYRFHGSEDTPKNFNVGLQTIASNVTWVSEKPFGKFTGPTSTFTGGFSSPISSIYTAFGSAFLKLYWKYEPIACGLNCSMGYEVRNEFTSGMTRLQNAINASVSNNSSMLYRFDREYQIPAIYPGPYKKEQSIPAAGYELGQIVKP